MDKQNVQADEREDFRRAFAMLSAAFNALKGAEAGTIVEFKCPLCGGTASATRSVSNEHKHAKCSNCGFRIME